MDKWETLHRAGMESLFKSPTATNPVPISQAEEDMSPEKFMHSMIGYHLNWEGSLCGMAMTQGIRKRVVNIGMAMKQFAVEPRGAAVMTYVESQSHKVSLRASASRHMQDTY